MATEITTKALVKTHLGISSTGFDSAITNIVNGVNAAIEAEIDDTIGETTYTNEEYDMEVNTRVLVLKHRPVITFTRLQYKDSPTDYDDTDWTSYDTDEYVVDNAQGLVTKNTNFDKGKRRYRATYSAGYETVPADIITAATIIAGSLFSNRNTSNVTSETLGQYSRTFAGNPNNWKSLGVDRMIAKYKKRNWFSDAIRFD